MKRTPPRSSLFRPAALALPVAALMLGSAHAATTVGLNFQVDFGESTYTGKPVTADAFGVPLANWFNLALMPDAVSTNQTVVLPGGGSLTVSWRAANAWYSGINDLGGQTLTPGDDEVLWGYLDDGGSGYSVTISGLRGISANYKLLTIAATDGGVGFSDVTVRAQTATNTLNYTELAPFVPVGGGGWATSTVSSAFTTLSANDSVTIAGVARNGSTRSTLAGILLEYTGGVNAPLVETQPTTPVGTIFKDGSFVLTSAASGTAPLAYQWRRAGTPIPGATNAAYTNLSAQVADSGNYDVVVTNLHGAATSTVAAVAVIDVVQPVITSAPLSTTAYPGYDVAFKVAGTGGQLAYQWKKGTQTIPGATNASLTVSNVAAADAGSYTVTVSNPVGSVEVSAALTVLVPGAYDGAMASLKPLSYVRLNETGALPIDIAANAGSLGATGNGVYRSGAAHPVMGALASGTGTAAQFNGTSSHVLVPYAAELHPSSAFTFEVWVKPAETMTGGTLKTPISSGDFGDPRAGWLIYQSATGWNLRMFYQDGLNASLNITGGPVPQAGTWYHLAGTYDGTTATLYVDGQPVASGAPTAYVAGTAGGFALGMRADRAFYWPGVADEAAFYSAALSPARILAHYQAGTNPAPATAYSATVLADSPVVYLKLDEPAFSGKKAQNLGTLGSAFDGAYLSANANLTGDLGIYPGVVGPRPPAIPGFGAGNNALGMTNGYVDLGVIALNTNAVTFTCWLKRSATQPGDITGLVFERSSAEASGLHMMPNGELRYHWNGGQWSWASGLIAPEEEWAFVALVVEPTRATIYMDAGDGIVTAVNTATHAVVPFTSPILIGLDNGARFLAGAIDEVAVFNRSLTAGEISLLALAASGEQVQLRLVNGGIIQDVKPVGTPHHGTSLGSTWEAAFTDAAPRTRNGVRAFTATPGAQVTVPANPDFDSTVGTISFWMQATAPLPGTGSEGAILFDRRGTTGDVIVMTDAGSLFVQARGTGGLANSTSAGYLPDDLWHHVAYVYDQSATGSIKVYLDGALVIDNPNTIAWSWPTERPIELGRSHDGYWKKFEGRMDDFRFYNRALTEAEVGQVFASDALVDTGALKLRLDFDNAAFGKSLQWDYGTLQSTPALGTEANWQPVPGATSPYSFLPEAGGSGLFFRARVP